MMEKIYADLQEIFRDVFDDDSIILQPSTCADDIEDWDSLAQITLLSAIESLYQIRFIVEEVVALKNVGEMVELILRKL